MNINNIFYQTQTSSLFIRSPNCLQSLKEKREMIVPNCSFLPIRGLNIHTYMLPWVALAYASCQRSIHIHIVDRGCGHVTGFGRWKVNECDAASNLKHSMQFCGLIQNFLLPFHDMGKTCPELYTSPLVWSKNKTTHAPENAAEPWATCSWLITDIQPTCKETRNKCQCANETLS